MLAEMKHRKSQATGFDHMGMRRTHWGTVDAFGLDVIATSSLDSIIETADQDPLRGEGHDQQAQQDMTRAQGRPARTIQHPMVVDETRLLTQPHDTQARRHGTFTRREHRANQQDLRVFLYRPGKERGKHPEQGQQLGRQCQHSETSRSNSDLQLILAAVTFSKSKNGQSRAQRLFEKSSIGGISSVHSGDERQSIPHRPYGCRMGSYQKFDSTTE